MDWCLRAATCDSSTKMRTLERVLTFNIKSLSWLRWKILSLNSGGNRSLVCCVHSVEECPVITKIWEEGRAREGELKKWMMVESIAPVLPDWVGATARMEWTERSMKRSAILLPNKTWLGKRGSSRVETGCAKNLRKSVLRTMMSGKHRENSVESIMSS